MTAACLCIFAKAPVIGQVKTRLTPALSEQQACRVHEGLLQHCMLQTQSMDWENQFWATDSSHSYIKKQARQHGMSLHTQQGTNLGQRMAFAVKQSLKKFSYAIIIGTDCPSIDTEVITQAINQLKSGLDVVLSPAVDGGYVLIGFSTLAEGVFADIEWGTDRVLETTRMRLHDAGLRWSELATQRDIDRPDDLQYLKQNYPELYQSICESR